MELSLIQLLTIAFVFIFLVLLQILLYYRKKCSGFPFSHIMPHLIYSQITGKITEDSPLNHVLFQKIIDLGKKHAKEGLFMSFFSRPVLIIFGEEAIKVFSNEKAAVDKSPEYALIQDRMGHGLITSNGERWKSHRKLINPAFQMGMLKENISLFNEHAMALVKDMEKMAGKPSADLLNILQYHYLNALRESVFGLKPSEENREQLLRFVQLIDSISAMVTQRIFLPWLRPKFLLRFFHFGRKHYEEIKESDDFIADVISDMKKHVSSDETMDMERFGAHLRKSFTYILLNRHLNDSTFTLQDVHDEVKTILIAGYDSVTYSTMWCLFLLGLHPEIQDKVYNEIHSSTSDYITHEESCSLVYLECVIMESLRLYPIIPIFSRNLTEDVQYGKRKVFKDTTVVFCPYLSHRNSESYPDPDMFKPERFLSAESRKIPSLIPFSEGRRSCIGKNYGILEMKIFLAHILRNFEFTSLDRMEDIALCWTVVLSPAKPIRMKITSRHNKCS